VCAPNFAGAACDHCAPDHFGSDCSKVCVAATTCNSRGACDPTTGACVCAPGFAGVACDHLACDDTSTNLTVVIDGHDCGVPNRVVANGCGLNDQVNKCGVGARNHGDAQRCVTLVVNDSQKEGKLSGEEGGQIKSCAAQSDLGRRTR
jgi:hypothetical protein